MWHRVAEGLQKGAQSPKHNNARTGGELWQMCRSGNAFLILLWDDEGLKAASVWRFEKRDNNPCFVCLTMYGQDMRSWLSTAHEWINKLARENGAKWLVSSGRKGWLRIFDAEQWGNDYAVKVT